MTRWWIPWIKINMVLFIYFLKKTGFISVMSICECQCHSLRMYNHTEHYKCNPLLPSFMIHWGISCHLEPLTLEVGRNIGGQPSWPQTAAGREEEGERNNWDPPYQWAATFLTTFTWQVLKVACQKGFLEKVFRIRMIAWVCCDRTVAEHHTFLGEIRVYM